MSVLQFYHVSVVARPSPCRRRHGLHSMGKRKFAKSTDTGARPATTRSGQPTVSPASAFDAIFDDGGPAEPGLRVQKRPAQAVYLSIYALCVFLAVGTLLTLGTSTLPRLLSHWAWVVFTIFSTTIFCCRWFAETVEGWVTFWCTFMVNGLTWLNLVLVLSEGIAPGALWSAFDEHGGQHLLIAQVGSLTLLGFPPLAMLAYVLWERNYYVAIFNDFFSQLAVGHWKWNMVYHITSPVLPFSFWVACFRTELFTDLPVWPGAIKVLLICLFANGPLLGYLAYRMLFVVGSTHWFDGGSVLWSTGHGPHRK
jgi:hypothetical protein